MKFPITREILQTYNHVKEEEELIEEENQKKITQYLDRLCKEFKQSMPSNSNNKKFVWHNLRDIRSIGQSSKIKYDEYLPQFIEKLKEIFIGCDIIIDPLKTYLIIDWS
jgi:predicted ATPase